MTYKNEKADLPASQPSLEKTRIEKHGVKNGKELVVIRHPAVFVLY